MTVLLAFSRAIDRVNEFIGRNVAWLILASVLISAGNAIMRKTFDISSNAWLEVQWYLYGTAFLLAAAYTLKRNEHVRIDFVSNMLSKRTRDWIDLICHFIFLLPFVLLITWLSIPWVTKSIRSGEISANAGGLILWPAKIMVAIGFTLLIFQTFSEIIKRFAIIIGRIPDETEHHDLPPEAEVMVATARQEAGK
ncbi:TRAP transporter small permease subunit [Pseudohoeflea coraliihabitans]|uniref:TRAP transporter small permease protein n=1 Tax=Pseudohoeflea coraliihabitans TaxID=2860393 RepID=A0ABS6WK92_9HYPH|nr:TRAP transporter small permease subunit [Pseudohoeflea sp. DP4N28-3]MBW3096369.1 TRAP transporter small permease subunit [Pseudohoeflea sp. DP4N28-3]